jgi:hypothetical protein
MHSHTKRFGPKPLPVPAVFAVLVLPGFERAGYLVADARACSTGAEARWRQTETRP